MTAEIPEIVKVWKLGAGQGKVSATNHYTDNHGANLFCTANNKYLTWKKMPVGINLDFITDASVKKVRAPAQFVWASMGVWPGPATVALRSWPVGSARMATVSVT